MRWREPVLLATDAEDLLVGAKVEKGNCDDCEFGFG
jgi:hypothetical protein